MAVLLPGTSKCSLCGAVIAGADDWVAFPPFITDTGSPFWRYSDSAMHRSCFAAWDKAEQFRDIYNKVWPELAPGYPREMQADGTIVDLGAGRTA